MCQPDHVTAACSILTHGGKSLFAARDAEWKITKQKIKQTQTRTHYLILLRFVRKVTQAVGGEVPVGGGGATCEKSGME